VNCSWGARSFHAISNTEEKPTSREVDYTDEKLTQIAKSRVNRQALIDAGSEEELVSHQASSQAAGRTKKR
jgi:hypothetical protein